MLVPLILQHSLERDPGRAGVQLVSPECSLCLMPALRPGLPPGCWAGSRLCQRSEFSKTQHVSTELVAQSRGSL